MHWRGGSDMHWRGGSDMHWRGGWNDCTIKASPWVQEVGVELLLM